MKTPEILEKDFIGINGVGKAQLNHPHFNAWQSFFVNSYKIKGDIEITLVESDDFPLVATINNKGGQISLSGESHVRDDGNYNLELKLSPNNSASKNLRSSLKMFAEQQSDGSFVVKNAGNLEQFGIL